MKKTTLYMSDETKEVIGKINDLTNLKQTEIIELATKKFLEGLEREGYNINLIKI